VRPLPSQTDHRFFEFVAPSGVLKPGTSPRDAIYNTDLDPSKFPGPSATQFDRSQNDNALLDYSTRAGREDFIVSFSDQDRLLEFVGRLMPSWKEPMRFRRQLLRTNIPRSYNTATRVHYDQMYLRKMEPGAVTGWIPIGDVSPVSGGLLYLEGSRDMGLEIEKAFLDRNSTLPPDEQISAFNQNMLYGGGLTKDCAAFARATNRRWLVGDYRAGDVVFHHSCMIHCSANNEDPDERIRLATDVRFADKQAPFDDRWNEFYYAGDGK
jgi:phytanoyl-CoA hydroxylase